MSHELLSDFLYIHPPLAIAGYIFIFIFAFSLFLPKLFGKKLTKYIGLAGWTLTFLGLLTGMLWAQLAWGNYWSWDPKETFTFVLFLVVTAGEITFFEGKMRLTKWLAVSSCVVTILTALTSFIITGLHSFL
jgi:ABC-type transport system involved in cytochrome c biogenesis permease subunit